MLEVALIELVSAGLWRFFIRSADPEAALAKADAEAFVRRLLLAAPEPAGTLVNRCVTDLWHHIRANQLPTSTAVAHIELLPEILAADQAAPDDATALFTQSPTALADAIILAHNIDTSANDIDETVLTFLLETFLTSLKACRPELEALAPQFTAERPARSEPDQASQPVPHDAAAQDHPDPQRALTEPAPQARPRSRSEASLTLKKIARADALAISVPLLELITVALINRTRSPDLRDADLNTAAAEARSIRAELVAIVENNTFGRSDTSGIINAFDSARFEPVNRALTTIEEKAVRKTTTPAPRSIDHVECAITMRLLRARLHALQGADVLAARQMGNARRHAALTDHSRHWQLARLEARHYERAAFHGRAPDHIESAARACSTVLANLNANSPPELKAEIQSELAHYLIRLGQIEQSSSRLDIAAQLLADAIAALGHGASPVTRLLALVRQGDALFGLARLSGGTNLIDRAIESYENAIDVLPALANLQPTNSPDRRPFDESVLALRTRLALALALRLDTETETNLHEAALETIVDVLPGLTAPHDVNDDAGFSASLLIGLCHRVVAGWLAAAGDTDSARRRMAAATEILEDACFERLAGALKQEIEPRLRNAPAPKPAPAITPATKPQSATAA